MTNELLTMIECEVKCWPAVTTGDTGRGGLQFNYGRVEPFLGVLREGKKLSDFDFLNKSAATMLDELAWWTRTLKAGRVEEATIAKLVGAAR